MSEQYRYFVGIDWATESHEVCVLNAEEQVVDRKAVEHSGSGIAQFVEYLDKLVSGDPEQVAIGIEIPRGALVETLVERGFAVYSLNPKQMDRFRDRHTVAGAKDDRRDALVIADSLRTDMKLFHRVRIDDRSLSESASCPEPKRTCSRNRFGPATSCAICCDATFRSGGTVSGCR